MAGSGSGISVTMASAVRNVFATEHEFCKQHLTTFDGSIIPPIIIKLN